MSIKFTSHNEFINSEHPNQRFRVDYDETTKSKVWYVVRTDGERDKQYGHIAALGMTLYAWSSTLPSTPPVTVNSVIQGYDWITS